MTAISGGRSSPVRTRRIRSRPVASLNISGKHGSDGSAGCPIAYRHGGDKSPDGSIDLCEPTRPPPASAIAFRFLPCRLLMTNRGAGILPQRVSLSMGGATSFAGSSQYARVAACAFRHCTKTIPRRRLVTRFIRVAGRAIMVQFDQHHHAVRQFIERLGSPARAPSLISRE